MISSSASLGVKKPDPALLRADRRARRLPTPAEVAYVGDRVDNDVDSRGCRRAASRFTSAAGRGDAPANAAGGRPRLRRPRLAAPGASLAPVSELRIGLGVDAHAFEAGVPLVLGGVAIDHPRGPRRALRRRRDRPRAHGRPARRRRARRHRRSLPLRRRALPRRRLGRAARRGVPPGAGGRLRARQRRLRADRPGAADRAVSGRDGATGWRRRSASAPAGSACVRRPPTSSASPAVAKGSRRRRWLCSSAPPDEPSLLHLRGAPRARGARAGFLREAWPAVHARVTGLQRALAPPLRALRRLPVLARRRGRPTRSSPRGTRCPCGSISPISRTRVGARHRARDDRRRGADRSSPRIQVLVDRKAARAAASARSCSERCAGSPRRPASAISSLRCARASRAATR